MSLSEKLSWTSRAQACDALIDHLKTTAPVHDRRAIGPKPWRSAVAELLSLLATSREVSDLRRLVIDRREEEWVRTYSLRGLVRLEAQLPLEELEGLLAEEIAYDAQAPDRRWDDWGHQRLPSLEEILRLARTPVSLELATRLLAGLPARVKVLLLRELAQLHRPISPVIEDSLYQTWLLRDRRLVQDPAELDVAVFTSERHPESRALVLERWSELSGEQRDQALWRMTRTPEGRLALAPGRPPWRAAAEALLFPIPDLVDAHGEEHALDLVFERIGRDLERLLRVRRARVHWTFGEWTAAAERTVALLEDRDLDPRARVALAELLFRQDRARAGSWALERARANEDLRAIHRVIEHAARKPRASERPLSEWAISCREAAPIRYLGLEALEALGGESALSTERIRELTNDPDGFVRLRALGALARRGDDASVARLRSAVVLENCVRMRGEALSWLAESDASAHAPLFGWVLLHDHETWDEHWAAPAAEEAALGLARAGTPEALTALLRGYLVAPTNTVSGAIEDYLNVHLAPERGEERRLRPHGFMWRGTEPHDPFWRLSH